MKYREYRFSDLLLNIVDNRGKTCPVEKSGLPLIATNCIKNESLYPVFEKVRYVSDETYNNWFRGHPEPDDIIFVCKGSPGRVAWTPNPVPFCIAQDMVAIRADKTKVHPKYLFALLRSKQVQEKILSMHVGSLIPHFKKGDFKNLYLSIPEDLEVQKQIGEFYFQFCEKIEINTQMNQTLEKIAQRIFKSWFIDFDPVKANAEGLPFAGLSPEIQSLFPSEFVESEMGLVPKGWDVSDFGSELNCVGGATPSTKNPDFWKYGDIHWTSPKDLSGSESKILIDTSRKITKLGLKKISSGLLPINTVLMSSRAPVGYLALSKVPIAINQGYIAMKCDNRVGPLFTLNWLEYHMGNIKQHAGGTTFSEISKQAFRPLPILVATNGLLSAFEGVVQPLYDKIESNIRTNQSLKDIRDRLLPKLLSGQIQIDEQKKAS